MKLFDMFRRQPAGAVASPRAEIGESGTFYSLDDPQVIEFLRDGLLTASGFTVNVETALRNPAMFRACSLISNSIGMLPLNLIEKSTKKKATAHPLYKLLHRRPNEWQTAFDFRALMQLRALVYRNAYALIVRSPDLRTGQQRVIRFIPLESRRMDAKLNNDWTVRYQYQPKAGGTVTYSSRDILHLRSLSLDGLNGFSLVEQAKEAIGLALSAQLAAGRLFKNGAFVAGALKHPGKLSDPAFERLKASLAEKEGAENAGKTLILEEGMDWGSISVSARDAQMTELRKLQVEEIGRVSGVPRPLLMVDETSWGSGIEALGQFFVAYGLNPWFEAWQQAVERSALSDEEVELYEAKFNPAALLRGSMKDQADFLAKALGSGGHQPWMHVDEVRDVLDLPEREAPPHVMISGQPGTKPAEEKPAPGKKPAAPTEEDEDDAQ
ncbi:MAG: phage portal protein [Hyphomicrobiales bacterium]|nr:MAG: phage portal protein [Hyphomicrobiales bacterium]